ncbi:hypothetical protein CANCADRAFT_16654, partial [Tortispora caseinolytica NRRL Y-17796]
MGQVLSEPITEKDSESGSDKRVAYGVSSMQGWRVSMEDAHAAVLNLVNKKNESPEHLSFFAVYDGHGGSSTAEFAGKNLHDLLAEQPALAAKDYPQALKDSYLSCDRSLLNHPQLENDPSGCTATSILLSDTLICAANAGDSRTVLCSRGYAKPLSFDHKPQNEFEKLRIDRAGGWVESGRVNGNLALSRALGDFSFKRSANLPPEEQIVSAVPEIIEHTITADDEFVVLACDGIWDCMTNQQVVEFVRRSVAEGQDLDKICENIMNNCLAPASDLSGNGCDNMTVVIVALLQGHSISEWYQMVKERVEAKDGPAASLEAIE